MSRPPTPFEMRVLRALAKGSIISGHGMVAWLAAAHRLEKLGFLYAREQTSKWGLTDAGRAVLTEKGVNDA